MYLKNNSVIYDDCLFSLSSPQRLNRLSSQNIISFNASLCSGNHRLHLVKSHYFVEGTEGLSFVVPQLLLIEA